ncbi:hypothetical protein D9M68_364060 [compost metagenome]
MAAGDSRRASGTAMESSRRASGADIVNDLRALQYQNTQERKLRALNPRGALAGQRGRADWAPPATAGAGGGGIASPLEERVKIVDGKLVPDRTYYDAQALTTSDGVFTHIMRPIRRTVFTDASDSEEVRNWANPLGVAP